MVVKILQQKGHGYRTALCWIGSIVFKHSRQQCRRMQDSKCPGAGVANGTLVLHNTSTHCLLYSFCHISKGVANGTLVLHNTSTHCFLHSFCHCCCILVSFFCGWLWSAAKFSYFIPILKGSWNWCRSSAARAKRGLQEIQGLRKQKIQRLKIIELFLMQSSFFDHK